MNQHPSVYWRKQRQTQTLLGEKGLIISVTKVATQPHWSAVVAIEGGQHTGAVIANSREPEVGDEVIGVLRIVDIAGEDGLVQYGIKFQLAEEVFL